MIFEKSSRLVLLQKSIFLTYCKHSASEFETALIFYRDYTFFNTFNHNIYKQLPIREQILPNIKLILRNDQKEEMVGIHRE